MGLVKKGEEKKGEEDKAPAPTEAVEDPPVVKTLKELDDKYLALENDYNKEVHQLILKYTEMQRPLLEERKQVLLRTDGNDAATSTGTPALTDFWLLAMQHHPDVEDTIQEWDMPVLSYLQDIEKGFVDAEDGDKGFTLVFRFAPNPYFSDTELKKEYLTQISNPYSGEIDIQEIRCTEIHWNAGKDVTVEKVQKKVKGGGAKKQKQKQKEREEPRPSFFRDFFRNLKEGMKLPEDAKLQARSMMDEDDEDDDHDDDDDDEDDSELINFLMESDHEIAMALRDYVIPFAVRWYTGEAAPDDDDDDDEDDDDDDDEDDEDDDEDSWEDEPPARGRGKAAPKKKPVKDKGTPETKPSEDPKQECKQQ